MLRIMGCMAAACRIHWAIEHADRTDDGLFHVICGNFIIGKKASASWNTLSVLRPGADRDRKEKKIGRATAQRRHAAVSPALHPDMLIEITIGQFPCRHHQHCRCGSKYAGALITRATYETCVGTAIPPRPMAMAAEPAFVCLLLPTVYLKVRQCCP